jgi:hypothetical protein
LYLREGHVVAVLEAVAAVVVALTKEGESGVPVYHGESSIRQGGQQWGNSVSGDNSGATTGDTEEEEGDSFIQIHFSNG